MEAIRKAHYDEQIFATPEIRCALERLLLINLQVTNFKTRLGLRKSNVICIDREDKVVVFVPYQDVERYFALTLLNWLEAFEEYQTLEHLAFSLTQLWMSFITVHPFEDGNGRTIKEFIRQELRKNNLAISNFDGIDQVLMKGNISEEVPLLESAFRASLFNIK